MAAACLARSAVAAASRSRQQAGRVVRRAALRVASGRAAAHGRPLGTVTTCAGREVISAPADRAPAALGPYSQAIKVDSTLYVSGCIGIIPGTKDFAGDDVASQTEQVMKNMGGILEAAGSGYDKVIKTTILLANMEDFATVNGVYGSYFPENPPARSCFAVKELPLGALVEIEAIALA